MRSGMSLLDSGVSIWIDEKLSSWSGFFGPSRAQISVMIAAELGPKMFPLM